MAPNGADAIFFFFLNDFGNKCQTAKVRLFFLKKSCICQKKVVPLHEKRANDKEKMQVIKKIFEYFTAEKYRDLNYGTIYYVAGDESPEINDYVLARIDQLSEKINQNEHNWVTCKIVYLNAVNPLFNTRKKATLYSPMLPFDKAPAEANIFFAAYLDISAPEIVEDAISEYFSTLQQMFDEVLDTGHYEEYHLRNTILSATDDSGIRFCISRNRDDGVMFSITNPQPFPFTEPSRLEITPSTYQILLSDYNREIRFGAQVKALYVLFLRHPEGIRMAEIYDDKFKQEYTRIYMQFTNRSDVERLKESIEKLFDVFSPNAMNVKKSQCNSTICRVIPNANLYSHYIIEAHRGLEHRINLDRSLVSMPEILYKV